MASTHLAVLGSPIEHSKSPVIHAAAYEFLGLDWDYGRYRIEADELEGFLKLRDSSWRGLSLTMPLKEEAYRLSIPSCPVAAATGVVNTLLHTDVGWEGYNTDSFGIMQALIGAGLTAPNRVAILGSGATARSAINAVKVLNSSVEIDVFARKTTTVMDIDTKPITEYYESVDYNLTISTLPGSVGHPEFSSSPTSKIFDVAYDPWPSKLAANWSEQNRISGFEMLLWQAISQLRLFVAGDGRVEFDDELKLVEIMRNSTRF